MKQSNEVNEIFTALSKAQGALKNAEKDKASDVGYKYAQLSGIIDIARGPLVDNDLSVIQMPSKGDNFCELTTMITHSSGQWIKDTLKMPVIIPMSKAGNPMMNHAQAVGNVITYMRRYSLAAFLNIAQEDTDAASGEGGATRHTSYKPSNKKASEKQVKFVRDLVQQKWNVTEFREKFGVMAADDLTSSQAKEAIDFIQAMIYQAPSKRQEPANDGFEEMTEAEVVLVENDVPY
ncbi:MAG: hypothetical protein GY820_38290 [Gammaproteobacteria bacterium]|nr:hypothetical protein [Gammaproteobacteria bacterium]